MNPGSQLTSTHTGSGSGFRTHVLGVHWTASVKFDRCFTSAHAALALSTREHLIEISCWHRCWQAYQGEKKCLRCAMVKPVIKRYCLGGYARCMCRASVHYINQSLQLAAPVYKHMQTYTVQSLQWFMFGSLVVYCVCFSKFEKNTP